MSYFLKRFVCLGALIVVYSGGKSEHYGEKSTAPITVRLHTAGLARRLLLDADLNIGEAYMDGTFSVDDDDIYGLIDLLLVNLSSQPNIWHYRFVERVRRCLRGLSEFNPIDRSRLNAAHHYDLTEEFYELLLDGDRQYSCAYFRKPGETLEAAQSNKKALIAAKLLLKPEQRVLDIGCGWGGLALHLAREYETRVTGVTPSQEQYRVAQMRAESTELSDRVQFRLWDYREIDGCFDRIVSVGMFEHVGFSHYEEFFGTLRDRLADDGVALIHTIGRAKGPGATNPWIAKYIFPGGYVPALSEIVAAVERTGLYVTDVDVWRLHYAETLKAWRSRFEANLDRVHEIYDERFCRMWRFYLASSELAFRRSGHVVFQIQIAKSQDAVPLTRDYLFAQAEMMQRRNLSVGVHER